MLTFDALTARWTATATPTVGLPTPTSFTSVEPSDLVDVLRMAADTTGDRAFFDAAETYSAAGRRAVFTSDDGSARRSAAEAAHQLRAASALLGSLAKLDPATGRRVEAAELALAIASLLAERAAWHERKHDRPAAQAALQAHRLVTASAAGATSSSNAAAQDRSDATPFVANQRSR